MTASFARLRVTARIARRQVARTVRSSVLVVLMVALPVGALGAGAIIAESSLGTPGQRAEVELGQNAAYVRIVHGPDPSLQQHPSEPQWTSIDRDETAHPPEPIHPVLPMLSSPAAKLPPETRMLPVSDARNIKLETVGGMATMSAVIGDVGDGAFRGRFDITGGTVPDRADEVLATQAALDRIGVQIGDTVALREPAFTGTITGIVDFAAVPDTREMLFLPWENASAFAVAPAEARWYLPDLTLSWEEIQGLNTQGITAYSRSVVLDPPPTDSDKFGSADTYWQTMGPLLVYIAAAAVFAAYQVALLAGAAFAVSARRQRQSLAMMASVGAAPREVRRVMLLQGTVLGTLGGLLGLGLGALAAWVFLQAAHTGDRTQFWGYNVPWWLLAAILAFAVTVGTLSALLPARGAAKADVLGALRGSRKPQQVSVARPVWGSVFLLIGLALTVAGLLLAAWAARVDPESVPWDSPLRSLPYIGIIAGPLLAQIGIIVAGGWILHLVSRVLSRFGLGARLASRDAASNASRSVPAFASIAAAVFISVFRLQHAGRIVFPE